MVWLWFLLVFVCLLWEALSRMVYNKYEVRTLSNSETCVLKKTKSFFSINRRCRHQFSLHCHHDLHKEGHSCASCTSIVETKFTLAWRNMWKKAASVWSIKYGDLIRIRKKLELKLVLNWVSSFYTLLVRGHFLLVLVNDFVREWVALTPLLWPSEF